MKNMWFLLRLPLALLLVTMTLPSISTARPFSTRMLLLATTITATVNAAASSSASSVVAIAACDGRSDKKELQVICKIQPLPFVAYKKCQVSQISSQGHHLTFLN